MRSVCFLDRAKIYANLTDFILSAIPIQKPPFLMVRDGAFLRQRLGGVAHILSFHRSDGFIGAEEVFHRAWRENLEHLGIQEVDEEELCHLRGDGAGL